ncbi:mitochondrial import inner membrane translocase subunit TIM14-1-like [Rutidosis leptorrhynchoides]|uniref:mitochondrial import inner membrane translocase subunit TIM14-1-like n=1 Tax=Rutidosis leptorrhynchoides TaxID=125765 RepID=UPI003A9921BF
MVDKKNPNSSSTATMKEDQNDTEVKRRRSWKETTVIVGLTIAATVYARRRYGPAWRKFKADCKARAEEADGASNRNNYPGGFQNTMTTKEAALILGIGESSATDKVKEAYLKAITRNHPDTGGSPYLAAKINQAKDVLMKKTKIR